MSKKEKTKKFYYYDEKNDLLKCEDSNETPVAVWVNNFLTLMFPIDCEEFIPKNIIGFEINFLQHILKKAKEAADTPLTLEERKSINKIFKEAGWKINEEE